MPVKMYNTIAIVVTYNRKKLLIECLEAISKQTVAPALTIVVDNASTDGTNELLTSEQYANTIKYLQLEKNIGGSGGFYEGMKYAIENYSYDFLWIMDDDTIPEPDCLEELLNAYDNVMSTNADDKISYLVSKALTEDRQGVMNVPDLDLVPSENGFPTWHKYLEFGLARTREATFVSIMFPKEAIQNCGLPIRDYFIWGDDSEYTMRLKKFYGPGYIVGKSKAIHKRENKQILSIWREDNVNRIKMFYYCFRNQTINRIYYTPPFSHVRCFLGSIKRMFPIIFTTNGMLKYKVALKGTYDGCFNNKKFIDFINAQIKKGK